MLQIVRARMKQGYKTIAYPNAEPTLPELYTGKPIIRDIGCIQDCHACVDCCPTGAIINETGNLSLDLGKCIFCTKCVNSCPVNKISFSKDYRIATNQRDALIVSDKEYELAKALDKQMLRIFGRSLKLRQVSAGGCGACEADTNVLNTIVFDLGRFGIQFVASPRHADGILVTGPVTKNMELALTKTYQAISSPKLVIAVGACAISGGIFAGHEQVNNGVNNLIQVDLYIPGCPPHPITILNGLLRLMGRI